jgi:VanZ family protein
MLKIFRWIPALVVMSVIFLLSAQPSFVLPDFGWADYFVKKGGHMIGYALLALSFWYALEWKGDRRWLAWLLALLYAMTDEFHQMYVPGRNSSIWDVVIFDNLGGLIALWLAGKFVKQKRPDESA